jgi:CRISPR-associated protein Cas2
MWVIAVYDCPMVEAEQRHDYTVFHRTLLQANYLQLQNSLYAKHFPTMAAAEASIQRLKYGIPEGAKVAFFLMTDKQYAMTREFYGTQSTKKQLNVPEQIELF